MGTETDSNAVRQESRRGSQEGGFLTGRSTTLANTSVAAGRTAFVTRLRAIADRLEELPLDAAAAEVLVLLEPAVDALERHARLALERTPTGAV